MRIIDADEIMKALSIFNDRENGNRHFLYGIETAKELIEDAPTIGGWISVEDRLPEDGVWVLVWEKQGFAYSDKLVSGVWQIGANNGAIITHWMPLPEGPEEMNGDAAKR